MEKNEFLQILSETTSTMIALVRANLERIGVISAEKLRAGKIDNHSNTDSEEESVENVPRVYNIDEQIQYNIVVTNVMRLMATERADVKEYCAQCLSTLLDILGTESNIVKYECPKTTVDLYKKICEANQVGRVSLIDKLSQAISLLYNNINV